MRWIVGRDDGKTVRDVLATANVDAAAVRDGRVFVGRRRVRSDDERVGPGDVLDIAAVRTTDTPTVRILLQAGDLVAVDKPAGIPTIPDHEGSAHALVTLTANVLGVPVAQLHPTSRLDREVSGVVVFSMSKDAADRLARARGCGAYERRYVAVSANAPPSARGTWDAEIGRAPNPRLRAVGGRDAVAAKTHYAVVALAVSGPALLAIAPVTGRTHQIRVHAADAGVPLVGDRTYGGPVRMTLANGCVVEPRRIALHAARVVVWDERDAPLVVTSPIPPALADLWLSLGGDPGAWDLWAQCRLG